MFQDRGEEVVSCVEEGGVGTNRGGGVVVQGLGIGNSDNHQYLSTNGSP